MTALVVDLGGTFLRCGIVDDAGSLLDVQRSRISNVFLGLPAETVWDRILAVISDYAQRHRADVPYGTPIVISFPGPVREHKAALCAPTIAGAERPVPDLATLLTERTSFPVWLINDVSAAACYLSRHIDVASFMVVTVSSGIGSKVFDRRKNGCLFDDVAYGGEIGHVVVDEGVRALPCDCGARGHLGAIASGRGTERLARRIALEDPVAFRDSTCVRELGAEPGELTNEAHLVPAARSGDGWVWMVIRAAMRPLAQTLAVAVHTLGLQKIIIIGGFAQALGQRYADELTVSIQEFSSGPQFEFPASRLVLLGDVDHEACLRGAAAFASEVQLTRV